MNRNVCRLVMAAPLVRWHAMGIPLTKALNSRSTGHRNLITIDGVFFLCKFFFAIFFLLCCIRCHDSYAVRTQAQFCWIFCCYSCTMITKTDINSNPIYLIASASSVHQRQQWRSAFVLWATQDEPGAVEHPRPRPCTTPQRLRLNQITAGPRLSYFFYAMRKCDVFIGNGISWHSQEK